MNQYQDFLDNAGLDLPKDFSLTTEGLSVNLFDFISKTAKSIRLVMRKVVNTAVIIEAPTPKRAIDFQRLIENEEWGKISKLRVFVPSKMNGGIGEHLEVLQEQIEKLVTVEQRLLDPLLKFTAEAVASPGVLQQVWVDENLQMLDTDAMKKKLEKTFRADKINEDSPYESNYGKAFGIKKEVYRTADRLKDMLETAASVDLGIIIEKEKELSDLIDDIVDIGDSVEINKQVAVKLANAVQAAAIELEYIAAAFYYLVVNISTFNETHEYTERVIKEGL